MSTRGARSTWARVLFVAAIAILLAVCGSTTSVTAEDAVPSSETFSFQTEVTRMMDILINSLYSNKDVFLRELISNASDATDKIRLLSLTDPDVLGEGEVSKLEIFISVDHENGILKIRDRGIGMTREDLKNNLGTIAKSGTSTFADKFAQAGGGQGSDLIGQFGVGFYSVYLVAASVQVVSKHNDDDQYVWESNAGGQFTITKDLPENYEKPEDFVELGRGTELRIKLRDDVVEEYSDEDVLMKLVKKYSEFINFPISLMLPEQEEVMETEAKDDDDDEDDDAEPEFKTVYKWHQVNSSKSVWTQSSADTTIEEYNHLYKVLAKGGNVQAQTYLEKTHFKAEGDVEFKAVLYIPDRPNDDYFDKQKTDVAAKIKLYVRRVFITDSFHELIPNYLAWIVGVVDSDSLPLNVSRETLQQHSSMKTIKKKVVRKALDTVKKIKEDGECYETATGSDDCITTKYDHFWKYYGQTLKYGFVNDTPNRSRLINLLRFKTSKSDGKEVGLDEYEARTKEGQKYIYYIAEANGEIDNIINSPSLEQLFKLGYEVLYLTDSIDEWIASAGFDYRNMKFQNANAEDLKLVEGDDPFQGKRDQLRKKYKPLLKWWKDMLIDPANGMKDVSDVRISNRLEGSPATVVNDKFSTSANMDKILNSQFHQGQEAKRTIRKILEINLRHPIIKKLNVMFEAEQVGNSMKANRFTAKEMALAVYQTALVNSGYEYNKKMFTDHVFGFLGVMLGIDENEAVDDSFDLSGFVDDGKKIHINPITGEEMSEEDAEKYKDMLQGEVLVGHGKSDQGEQEPDAPDPETFEL